MRIQSVWRRGSSRHRLVHVVEKKSVKSSTESPLIMILPKGGQERASIVFKIGTPSQYGLKIIGLTIYLK